MPSLPPGLAGREYYQPKAAGWEEKIRERLQEIRRKIRDEEG
jgi:replication-associated recombination protein RarA